MKAKDLRDESIDELEAKQTALRAEIFELRSERLDGKTQKTHLIGQKRRDIARIKTVLVEKAK
ncbi:MAG: 50S ribosomal protein L29 [Chlamydiae bacterium]|nr:50S ribosomal protein L29 [Chlamydiota bacterium]